MTTEQLSSSKKTWAQLAEEEDDEIENCQFTTNSETLDKNEIPSQLSLTKSISEFQPKTRSDRQKNNKQRDNDNNGLKNYRQNNTNQNKGNNRHNNRQNKSQYDETYDALFETTNQEILLKVKPQNKNDNLEAVKEYFEKQYQNIKAFLRNDINQIDLLISPKIGLLILEDHKFKIHIADSNLSIYYPQYPNEPLSDYYAKKKYLDKKVTSSGPLFQRSAMSSKVSNSQQDCNDKSDNGSKQDFQSIDKVQNDQNYIYKQKDNIQDVQDQEQEQEINDRQNKQIYEKKDFNKQQNQKFRKYNNNYNEQYDYDEDYREYKEEKQSNYKSHKYRNEQHSAKDPYQNQKYYSNADYEYTEKQTSDKNKVFYEEKESHKDYRNNQNYQNYNNTNNNNNNHYNQKRSYKGNTKQKNDQYVIYEVKQKSDYEEASNNLNITNDDHFEEAAQVSQNINQTIYNSNENEEKNEDIHLDSDNDQGEEQVEETKSPNKNKKKKKNKKNQKALKPNDTNFFGILQSVTK